uniref:5'-(N(7)-methylguanosine 5'-triphospho)-[mRNA] hydrolase n=1 Tax=Lepisosteus oculatus TaxID=7918 RepID=W5NIT2_LEPOC
MSSTSGMVSGTCLAAKGLDISLAALQRHDPYINKIVDVASQVALYTFSNKANEWEKTDVEGTLFVYTRSASPRHGFTIMNRLSMDNLTEPITKDLDFQLQDPFLLYRNARLSIYGIWFYDKEDCQRIAELMKNLTQQEQLKAQHGGGVSPKALHSGDSKGVDILQMLNKARDEYDKSKPEPKEIAGSSVIYDNPNLIKPIPVKPIERAYSSQQLPKDGETEPKHLSLAALFGVQDKQEPVSPGAGDNRAQAAGCKVGGRPAVARSLSYEEPAQVMGKTAVGSPPQHCPAIQKLMTHRGAVELQPVSESPENRLCENGGLQPPAVAPCASRDPLQRLFQPPAPCCAHPPPQLQTAPNLLHRLPIVKPDRAEPLSFSGAHQSQALYFSPSKPPLVAATPQHSVSGVVSPHELLHRLQLVQQEQSMDAARPALAARFHEPLNQTSRPLDSWADKTSSAVSEKPNPLFQVISPQRIPATVAPTLLMSPMVFTQTKSTKSSESNRSGLGTGADRCPPSSSLLSSQPLDETFSLSPSVLTRSQFQCTLLHLIKNDPSFLNTIYEAYISRFNTDKVTKPL